MSEVTLEQLLALLEEERLKEPRTKEENLLANHGERFLADMDVQPGTYLHKFRTRTILMFWRYLKWCIENGERPLTRQQFFQQVGKYYKSKSVRIGRYHAKERVYPILPDPFEIPPEEIRAAEMVLRDEREKGKWVKKVKDTKEMNKRSRASKKTSSPKSNKNTTT